MAFKLDTKKRDAIADELEALHEKVEEAVTALNAAIDEKSKAVTEAVEAYNTKLKEAADLASETASDARDTYDERSDGWREGDKGQAVDSWITELEGFDDADLEVDLPETIETPDSHADQIRELPERPDA